MNLKVHRLDEQIRTSTKNCEHCDVLSAYRTCKKGRAPNEFFNSQEAADSAYRPDFFARSANRRSLHTSFRSVWSLTGARLHDSLKRAVPSSIEILRK